MTPLSTHYIKKCLVIFPVFILLFKDTIRNSLLDNAPALWLGFLLRFVIRNKSLVMPVKD